MPAAASAAEIVAAVESLLAAGLVFQAFETASAGLDQFTQNGSLRVLRALALARTGAVNEAVLQLTPWLDRVIAAGRGADLGRVIGVYHEAWRQSGSTAPLAEAVRIAQLVARRESDVWACAHAAALAHLASMPDRARHQAEAAMAAPHTGQARDEAGLLLAGLILAEPAERLEARSAGVVAATGADYTLVVALRQLVLELGQTGIAVPDTALRLLAPPTVIVFTGHDLDRPGQLPPRLTAARLPALRAELDTRLDRLRARIGYVSPSAGAGILFVEAMQERGAEVNLILPFARDDFVRQCVAYAGPDWVARFERAVAGSAGVTYASQGPYLGHDLLFRYGNQILHGLATLRGQFLGTAPHLLAAWDHEDGSLAGDAADFIDQWGDIARLSLIDLSELPDGPVPTAPEPAPPLPTTVRVEPERELRVMLFADILGFGRLTDAHIPAYLRLLDRLQATLAADFQPELVNSWGDALFVVMQEASELAAFALRLCELVQQFGHAECGFPGDLDIRVSLHAGPVFKTVDPFTARTNFWGFDINRAARLEPVTVPGHVYATQPFVALLTSEQSVRASEAVQLGEEHVSPFVCAYVGLLPLAKEFGQEPIYHLRPRREAAD